MFTSLFSEIQDQYLRDLASQLPQAILNRWQIWAKGFREISVLPAKDIYVALFIVSCLQQSDTLAKITDVYHGLSWLHQSLGMKNPCESTLVMNLVEACRRELGKPKTKKEPISPEHLASLVKDFGHRKASLKDIAISDDQIIFYRTYIKVCIQKSKIDSYREGKWVLIARTGKLTCPVSMLKRSRKSKHHEDNFIFRFVELRQILSSI